MGQVCYTGYNSYTILTTFTSGVAGTVTVVDTFFLGVLSQVYEVQATISSISVAATTPGQVFIKIQDKGSQAINTTVNFPQRDVLLTVPVIALTSGCVGDGKILYGQENKGPIVTNTREFAVLFYSNTAGVSLNVLTTFQPMPVLG